MPNIQLYLNDELADLSDDSPIALTYQINNLADVQNQQGNTSNQFKLPLTQRNRRILGYPDELPFTTNAPYGQYPARIIADGLEILPYGVGELNSIDQDTASITVLSGNVDFFDAIDGQLYDMGDSTSQWHSDLWKQYDHTWSLANVVASQTKTDGWIWPVVDYGSTPPAFSDTATINVMNMRPGFFLKSAINLLAASAGYRIDQASFLVNDPLYNKLIVQFANDSFEHSTDVQNGNDGLSVTVRTSAAETIDIRAILSGETGIIPFNQSVVNPGNLFNNNGYSPHKRVTATVTLTFDMRLIGTIGAAEIEIGIRLANVTGQDPATAVYTLKDNPVRIAGTFNSGYKDFLNQKMSCDIDLPDFGSVVVFFALQDKNHTQCIISAGATLDIKSKSQPVLYGQTVQCERILPDISQKDLLKDTLQRFGIICQTNNTTRTIRLSSFRDIVNNIPIARNWSGKCLDQGKSISFKLGDYAQVNYMKYKTDDGVPVMLGQSQINIADTTLPPTADLFESQFAATLQVPYIGGAIAQIPKMEAASTDFTISSEPRILIDDKLKLNGQKIVFTDGSSSITVNDTVSVPYFNKPGGDYSLHYDDLRKSYYPELEKILKQSKKVVRYLLLTPRDILELDLLIPVYIQQDGAYYYINKIDSWRKGQPTRVELVKLG